MVKKTTHRVRSTEGMAKLDTFFPIIAPKALPVPIVKAERVPLDVAFEFIKYERTSMIPERPLTTRNNRILMSIATGPKNSREVGNELGFPWSTMYRELEYLRSMGIVRKVEQ